MKRSIFKPLMLSMCQRRNNNNSNNKTNQNYPKGNNKPKEKKRKKQESQKSFNEKGQRTMCATVNERDPQETRAELQQLLGYRKVKKGNKIMCAIIH